MACHTYNSQRREEYILVIILIVVILIAFRGWFNLDYIAGGDWRAWDIDSMKEWFGVFPAWENNEYGGFYTIEGANLIRYPIKFLYGALATIGLGFNVSERLLNYCLFLPLALIGMHRLTYYFFKNRFASTIASLYFTLNNYIFHYCYISHISSMIIPYALIPWILFYYIKNITDEYRLKNSLLLVLFFNTSLYYDTRITYLTTIVVGIYTIFFLLKDRNIFNNFKVFIRKNFLFFILTLLLNLFWILPMVLYPYSLVDTAFFTTKYISKKIKIIDAFLNTFIYFRGYYHYFTLLLISLLGFLGFFLKNKYNFVFKVNVKLYLYLTLLLFIFLAAGVTSPFAKIFKLLFLKVPGFYAFRITNKFSLIIAFVFSVLLAYVFSSENTFLLLEKLKFKVIFLTFFSFILLFNLNSYGVFNNYQLIATDTYNEYLSTFKTHKIPKEYKKLKEYFRDKKEQSILFFPGDPYYTIINKNLTGINSPDSNLKWPYLKEVFEWRRFNKSFLLSMQKGLGNLGSLIGIDYFCLLPEDDVWWKTSKDPQWRVNALKKSLKIQDDLEKIKICEEYFIYKNKYPSEKISYRDKKNIKFVSSIECIYHDNLRGFPLNQKIYFNIYSISNNDLKILFEDINTSDKSKESGKILKYERSSKSKIKLILKDAKRGDLIELKERYNPYWRLKYKSHMYRSIETAYQTNAFIIPADGTLHLELIFLPQKVVSFGFYVWISLLIIVFTILIYLHFIYEKNTY